MTVINTNIGAITARTYATKSSSSVEKSMERLSSGLRVNSGSDDAAGLAVAYKLDAQLKSTEMAIQNASNGVSLIQSAGAGMNKVNSMLVRIREVAVQMANGIYTDEDRQNGQEEVILLQEEIDKIAENLQFNEVYLLDGSYQSSFRTGVSNQEVFDLSIISQRAEELGKAAGLADLGTQIQSSSHGIGKEAAHFTAIESDQMIISQAEFGPQMADFLSTHSGADLTLSGTDADKFEITASGAIQQISGTSLSSGSSGSLTLTARSGAESFTSDITYAVSFNSTSAKVKSSQTTLDVTESQSLSFRAINSDNADDGMLSLSLQNFVAADNQQGTYSLSGDDAAQFTIDQNTGVISASVDFENAADTGSDNSYNFDLSYTTSTGDVFTESVTLNVSDTDEESRDFTISPSDLTGLGQGDVISLSIDGQTLSTTIEQGVTSLTTAQLAERLNTANTRLDTPARVSFTALTTGTGVRATFTDAAGNIDNSLHSSNITLDDRYEVTNSFETETGLAALGEDATAYVTEISDISPFLNQAETGDSFSIIYDGTTITASVGAGITAGNYNALRLASDLTSANNDFATPVGITFTVEDDKLIVTSTATGNDPSFSGVSFDYNGDNAGTVATTAGQNSVGRVVTIDLPSPLSVSGFDKNDFVELTVDGQTYRGQDPTLGNKNGVVAAITSALSGTDLGSLFNVVNGPGDTIGFVQASVSTDAATINAIEFESLVFDLENSSAINNLSFGTAGTVTEGDNRLIVTGAANNAASGRDNSASGNNTDSNATSDLAADYASRQTAQTKGANSTLNISDAFTMQIDISDLSSQLNEFISQNAFGSFSLTDDDGGNFTVDSFNGQVRTTAEFKSAPQDSYEFEIQYTGKNGNNFTNKVTINRIYSEDTAKDSVADINVSTIDGATNAITILDRAIQQMAAQEARMGAAQNRLEHAIDYLDMAALNTATSKGRILDADFARETSVLSKQQILGQASNAMLAQANGSKQMLMMLLN